MKLLVVVASVRRGRVGEKVAQWFLEYAAQDGRFEPELVDLRQLNLSYELDEKLPSSVINPSDYSDEQTKRWSSLVSSAAAVVFVSPEYNHGYPASLKNAIDHLYSEWNSKPVSFVHYGAAGGAYSYVALQLVCGHVKMRLPSARVAINEIWAAFDDDGNLRHQDYHQYQAKGVLDGLQAMVVKTKIT